MEYDIIIIGGGLGGLTAGAKLSKEGRKVLLIEQHSQPGGCATTFKRGHFTMEVGLHEMDGPAPRDMKSKIFKDLEVNDTVEFIRVPEFYHFINDKIKITIPHDPSEALRILKDRFPDEEKGLEAYFDRLLNSGKKPAGHEDIKDISVGEFLDSIISDDNLKLVLLGNLGYFHDDPYTLSLAYYTIAQGSYYSGGASFIKGGSQKLSDHLAGYIESHGGTVLLNHLVTELLEDGNRITGVQHTRKRPLSDEVLKAYASEIVVNSNVPGLSEMIRGKKSGMLAEKVMAFRPGASLLTVYFGFRKPLSEIGHNHYSLFVYDSAVKNMSDILPNNRADFDTRSFTFVDYGQIDSGLAPEGKSVGALCCIDYLEDWENLSRFEYELKKEDAAKKFISRLEKLIPGFSSLIEHYEVGTARTVKRYTLATGGAVYGFAQVPGKKPIDLSDLFENLHIASSWGKTGGGFSGAIFGGYLAAMNIMRKKQ
jgi:all-trans-retinol 13,14-reductase